MTGKFTFEAGSGVGRSKDDPTMTLLQSSAITPDARWIKTPPVLGGERLPVISVEPSICCNQSCGKIHNMAILDKVFPDGRFLAVLECEKHGFLWHKRREG